MRVVLVLMLSACGFSGASGNPPGDDGSNGSNTLPSDAGPDTGPCMDSDSDGICDVVDQCPGMDDKIDIDQDGVPDCKDDWPCGATKPNAPSGTVIVLGGNEQWSAYQVHITTGDNLVVVKGAGVPLAISFDWSILVNCGGPAQSCIAQLELGFAGIGRDRCVFDGTVTDDTIMNGHVTDTTTLTPTPTGAYQVYDLRLNVGRRPSCGTMGWDGPDPGGNSTIAKLCVVK